MTGTVSTYSTWLARGGPRREAGAILRLAVPVAAVALVNMAMSFTDTLMAASLGPRALAAVSLGGDAAGIVAVLAIGTIGGVAPAYARAAAAGDLPRLAALRSASWALAGLIALVTLPVIWSGGQILAALGVPGPLLAEGQGYIRAMAVNIVPLLALAVLRNRATALERPGLLLRIMLAALPLNAVLNWILMHGVGGWTGFGCTGLGLSSVVVTAAMALALAAALRSAGDGGARAPVDRGLVLQLGRVGLPIGISMLASLGIFLGATVCAARFGTEPAAAHALAIRLAGLAYAVSIGMTHACAVRAARRGPDEVWAPALGLAALMGLCLASLVAVIAAPMSRLVLPDSDIAALATSLVWLVAAMQLADPLGAAAAGILQGQDRTRATMVYSMIGNWGVSAPLIVLLSSGLDLGIRGLWIALVAGAAVSATATAAHLVLGSPARGGSELHLSDPNLPEDHDECETAIHDGAARQAA